MSLKLTEYIPEPDQLDPAAVIETRNRLVAYLKEFWPLLDTRPNSVFGDIFLTPMAVTVTALEVAMSRFRNDLDLANVSAGSLYDTDFIRAYLKNFGVDPAQAINASGTVKLVFNTDKAYVLDSSTTLSFGDNVFFFNPEEGNPIYIRPTSEPSAKRLLTKTGENQFEVFLPVTGTPGVSVNDGDQAILSTTIDELVSITAMGNMDKGAPPDNLITLADRAQRMFVAASLSSRSGAVSFCASRWPNLIAATATVAGDREMLRGGTNIFGAFEGALDLFVKSSATLAKGETLLQLTYDLERQSWIGRLTLPVVPAFYDLTAGIFQTSDFQNSRGVNQIYARSSHPTVRGLAVAYSVYEVLGIAIKDTNPTNFNPAVTGQAESTNPSLVTMAVRGEYNGSLFGQYANRSVRIRLDSVEDHAGVTWIRANARDQISGEVVSVYFEPNATSAASRGLVVKLDAGYVNMFNGLDLDLVPTSGIYAPASLVGTEFTLIFSGRTANFSVNYLYDPMLVQVDNVIGNPEHKPVNAAPWVRNLITCHVTKLVINYRVRYGKQVDVDSAREALVNYINGLAYPAQYEDSAVSTIMTQYGADGIQSINKQGFIYPSLAATYVEDDGTEISIPRVETTTLLPAVNDLGYGLRNLGYYIDRDTIVFNGTAY